MTKKKNETAEEREARLDYGRKYRERNREKRRKSAAARILAETEEQRKHRLNQMREWRDQQDPADRNAAARERKKIYRSNPRNVEKERAYAKEYAQRPEVKERARNHNFLYKRGISREDADRMIKAQGGLCAICLKPPTGKGHCARLHVDHCHGTGKIRGMLCVSCNTMLGNAKDSPEVLAAAAKYLEGN